VVALRAEGRAVPRHLFRLSDPVVHPPASRADIRSVRPAISVVVPAHNEELLLPRGLAAIADAARDLGRTVEVVVVANRCTDATPDIARDAGAVVVERGARNIAAV